MANQDATVPLLDAAPLRLYGRIATASNHTLLARVDVPDREVLAVYKPRSGERPLWDFPTGTLCQREVAAYEVDVCLGWGIVPPTVLRDGPLGVGSVQLFVPHDPRTHYFTLVESEAHHEALARLAVLDLLLNNADRKASHVLLDADGRIRGVDHGLTFHTEPKLRTVVWELGGGPLRPGWRDDLRRLEAVLADPGGALAGRLGGLLADAEVRALARRAGALARLEALPDVDVRHRGYPWPPL